MKLRVALVLFSFLIFSQNKKDELIYDIISNKIFKIVFDDYDGGVVVFRYAELSN